MCNAEKHTKERDSCIQGAVVERRRVIKAQAEEPVENDMYREKVNKQLLRK